MSLTRENGFDQVGGVEERRESCYARSFACNVYADPDRGTELGLVQPDHYSKRRDHLR
jgi:hypothetical protein